MNQSKNYKHYKGNYTLIRAEKSSTLAFYCQYNVHVDKTYREKHRVEHVILIYSFYWPSKWMETRVYIHDHYRFYVIFIISR